MIFLLFIIAIVGLIWLVSKSLSVGAQVGASATVALQQYQIELDKTWHYIEEKILYCCHNIFLQEILPAAKEDPNSRTGEWFQLESKKASQKKDFIRMAALKIVLDSLIETSNNFPFFSKEKIHILILRLKEEASRHGYTETQAMETYINSESNK